MKTNITIVSDEIGKATELMQRLTKGTRKIKNGRYIVETEDAIYRACGLSINMRGMAHHEVYIDKNSGINHRTNEMFNNVVRHRILPKDRNCNSHKIDDHIHYV